MLAFCCRHHTLLNLAVELLSYCDYIQRTEFPARLHIPAGILWIPVFSVPIASVSQESQYWFRSNLVFPEEKGVKPLQ
jgi:hypothetical protein